MESTYSALFNTYGESILHALERSYDDREILDLLAAVPLEKAARYRVESLMADLYDRWSVDAFALGLHLGLTLSHGYVRHEGPQQRQEV